MKEIKVCKKHGPQVHNKWGNKWYCRKCATEATQRVRVRMKRRAVDYLGGCCSICGYDECVEALDFHHLDPSKKEFNISHEGTYFSWNKIKRELDKCICLCANCHREIHASDNAVPVLDEPKKEINKICAYCGKEFITKKERRKFCSAVCSSLSQRKCRRPDIDILIKEIQELNFLQVGKKYGVTDAAIRKWLIKAGVNPKDIRGKK